MLHAVNTHIKPLKEDGKRQSDIEERQVGKTKVVAYLGIEWSRYLLLFAKAEPMDLQHEH
jgi:hypothetical protein